MSEKISIGLDARTVHEKPVGVGVYVLNLVKYFLSQKIKCFLFTERASNQLRRLKDPNLKLIKIPANPRLKSYEQRYEWDQKRLPLYIKKTKIDLYHATDSGGIPKNLKIPIVLTIHDLIPYLTSDISDPKQLKFYKLRVETAIPLASKIITVSRSAKRDIEKILKVPSLKIVVIYNGIPSLTKAPKNNLVRLKRLFRIKGDYLIYIGGIARRKNIDKLIRAFGLIRSDFNLQLVVVGQKHQPLTAELENLVKKKELNQSVIFTDYLKDIDKDTLLINAKILIYPSSCEGFGLPILEGFQAKVPVITSNISSMPEVAQDGAYLINPLEPRSIAKAITKLLLDKKLRNHLIKQGKQRINEFSWQKAASQVLCLYKQILQV